MAPSRAAMETPADICKRLGDEQSNLLDQFERMSFEAHLNRAMLGRSLSEPRLPTLQPLLTHQVNQGRRCRPPPRASAAVHKFLNKLFKPILRRNSKREPPPPPHLHPQHPLSCKTFSTSLRF